MKNFKTFLKENLEYIGNCIDTVDELQLWDATEMEQMIENSEHIDFNKILSSLPQYFQKMFTKFNTNRLSAGINKEEGIVWIYDEAKDIHYFFKKNNNEELNYIIKDINYKFAYHVTKKQRINNILKMGLLINQKSNYTESWIENYYEKIRPIFVSFEFPWVNNLKKDDIVLKIDVSGLDLWADFPSLANYGFYFEENGDIWIEEPSYSEKSSDAQKLGLKYPKLNWKKMVKNYNKYKKEHYDCIFLTKTAAILQNIPPERIKIIENEKF